MCFKAKNDYLGIVPGGDMLKNQIYTLDALENGALRGIFGKFSNF